MPLYCFLEEHNMHIFHNNSGGVVDDMIIYMISDEEYMLVVNASNLEKDWNWIEKHNDVGAELKNISDDYSF